MLNTNKRIAKAIFVLSISMIASCGSGGYGSGSGGVTAPPADGHTVAATSGLAFTPASLAVNAGEAVKFSFGSVAHNVFFDAGAGVPDDIAGTNADVTVSRTFTTAGTYHYNCHIHPAMQGEVVVR
jgi:plastocyanin